MPQLTRFTSHALVNIQNRFALPTECSVLLPQVFGITGQGCQLSVCRVSCLSVTAIPWTNATITRTSTFRHRRPFTSSQGVSTAEGIIHKQIGSRMTPNTEWYGVPSGYDARALSVAAHSAHQPALPPPSGWCLSAKKKRVAARQLTILHHLSSSCENWNDLLHR